MAARRASRIAAPAVREGAAIAGRIRSGPSARSKRMRALIAFQSFG
jgi:hypothetical protein